MSKTQSV